MAELMRLGLISLLLTVFQTGIGKICISERLDNILLPCKKPNSSSAVANFNTSSFASGATRGRRLLSMASNTTDYCSKKGKMPLLSVEAVHQLDVFIFVLATFHVVLCVLKALYMTVQWRHLETYNKEIGSANKQQQQEVLKETLEGYKNPFGWFSYILRSSLQISFTSLTKEEYIALRLNFFAARDPKDPGEDFQEYIIRILEKEFEKMIGISWYSWFLTVIYMLMNVAGWNAYFWISFIPFTTLFIIGCVLEFMITRLVKMVAKKHTQNENASSESGAEKFYDRWFVRPTFIGNLIHIMLFLNSLELAFFFFMLIQYGFHSASWERLALLFQE